MGTGFAGFWGVLKEWSVCVKLGVPTRGWLAMSESFPMVTLWTLLWPPGGQHPNRIILPKCY